MLGWARRLRRFSTTDGMGLLIVGIVSLFRAWGYAPWIMEPDTRSSHVAESWMPMDAWALVWGAVGVACVLTSVVWRSRAAALSVGAAVGLHFLFAFSFLWGTLHGDMSRGWVSALSYFAISLLLLWAFNRGRREDVTAREVVRVADTE